MAKIMTRDNRALRRTAREIKRYRLWMKILPVAASTLGLIVILTYIVAALYSKYGSFTVMVSRFDNVKYALTLSETPDFTTSSARLNTKASQDITNISITDLPQDLNEINGEHNGKNYVAYTYYMKNAGQDAVDAEYMLYIANMTQDIEKAVRIRLYVNGEYSDFARTRTDGGGPEPGTTEFLTEKVITRRQISAYRPDDLVKFTVVIWLEGDDPDCVDSIIGGQFKIDMAINILNIDDEGNQ